MTRQFKTLSLAATCLFGAHMAVAEPAKPVVLVELFTSQGCSSCPPADAMVAELADRDDVLPLALHVDYWDYIGWADKFAHSSHTTRQKGYARMAGSTSIYTPQMVIEGVDHIVGVKPMKLVDLIAAHRSAGLPMDIEVDIEGDTVRLKCAPEADMALPQAINVDIIRFAEAETVEILHGENAGRTITYTNIVTGWERLGSWSGSEGFSANVTLTGNDPLALIVQAEGPGPVLAAYRLR